MPMVCLIMAGFKDHASIVDWCMLALS